MVNMVFENSKFLPSKNLVHIYFQGDEIFWMQFPMVKTSNFQKPFWPFNSWDFQEGQFRKKFYDPILRNNKVLVIRNNAFLLVDILIPMIRISNFLQVFQVYFHHFLISKFQNQNFYVFHHVHVQHQDQTYYKHRNRRAVLVPVMADAMTVLEDGSLGDCLAEIPKKTF